jgi:hypothetical protein
MKEVSAQNESKHQREMILRHLGSGIAVVVSLALMVSFINRAYSVPAPVQATPYDGVTLYRGLFFGSGPVAGKIPTIRKAGPYFPAEYKRLEGEIIKYLQAKDPQYFERFAQDIQSGDRVRVAAAIRSTNKLQKEALLEVTKTSRTQFASQVQRLRNEPEPEPSPEPAKDLQIVIIYCLFIPIVTAVVASKAQPNELKGLSFEQYVNEIVVAVPKTRDVRPVVRPPVAKPSE